MKLPPPPDRWTIDIANAERLKTLVERRFATPIATGKLHRGWMIHVHYNSHIRIEAKRQPLDALDAARRNAAPNRNGDGNSSKGNEEAQATAKRVNAHEISDVTYQNCRSV